MAEYFKNIPKVQLKVQVQTTRWHFVITTQKKWYWVKA